jgi:phenylalanyl-tRNA synthetase beta chain
MMDILSRNYAYHNKAVKLYEQAKIYLPIEGSVLPQEPKIMVFGTYGAGETFFTLKGEVEALLSGLNVNKAEYTADSSNPSYHPGRCAAVSINGQLIGHIGQIHPIVAKNYGIDAEVYCAELNMELLFAEQLPEATYIPLPKYPAVTRDLAIVCDETITVAQAENVITKAAGKLLRNIRLFDIYRGTGIPEGKKSMAFSLELRADDRTLTDSDSDSVTTCVIEALQKEIGAMLR